MKLLLDLDGTIFPTYDIIARLVLYKTGNVINWNEVCEHSEHSFWQTPTGLYTRQQFDNCKLYANLIAYPCVFDTLRLAEYTGWEIGYVTARGPLIYEATYFSLGNNHLPFAQVTFVERKTAPVRKAKLAIELQAHLFVDDELCVCHELEQRYIRFVKIPQSYNTGNWKPEMVEDAWNAVRHILKGVK